MPKEKSKTSATRVPELPPTMRAAAVDRFGPPEALTLHELPVPQPDPGEILIALTAAGVGVWDADIRAGLWKPPGRVRFPVIPGTDGAGIVVAKGVYGASMSATGCTPMSLAIAKAVFTLSMSA
jgi:hypothetical protein